MTVAGSKEAKRKLHTAGRMFKRAVDNLNKQAPFTAGFRAGEKRLRSARTRYQRAIDVFHTGKAHYGMDRRR